MPRDRPPGRTARAPLLVAALAVLSATTFAGCTGGPEGGVLRLGFFPNLTHAQALYGVETSLYEEALGDTRLRTQVFNAGPTAIVALLSGRVDALYVGPSPTIVALDKTGSREIRILAGAASGGASFVLRKDVRLDSDADLPGMTFATPQLANTQDVAMKHWLLEHGQTTKDRGGDVQVLNAANPDILAAFQQRQLDGAWVPEPWATRLVREADGVVHVDEEELWPDGAFVTTHLVTTKLFLETRPDDVARLLAAHVEATERLAETDEGERDALNDAIERFTGKRIDDATLEAALENVAFTNDPLRSTFDAQYEMSRDLGFVDRPVPDLDAVYALEPLAAATQEGASP